MKYFASLLVALVGAQGYDWDCNMGDCKACDQVGRACMDGNDFNSQCDRGDCKACDIVGRPCAAGGNVDMCCAEGCGAICGAAMPAAADGAAGGWGGKAQMGMACDMSAMDMGCAEGLRCGRMEMPGVPSQMLCMDSFMCDSMD